MDGDSRRDHESNPEHLERTYVHDVYNKMAPHFSDRRLRAWPLVKEFILSLQAGSLLADIGCGNGKYLNINPDIYTVGCDMCTPLVNIARHSQQQAMVCDNLSLPYRDNVFDAVISIGVIHHFSTLDRRVRAIQELARILTSGGRLMIYVWALEQKRRKFEGQDVLIPWQPHPLRKGRRRDRVRSLSKDRCSSTSSFSEEDISSLDSDHPPIHFPALSAHKPTGVCDAPQQSRSSSSLTSQKLRSLVTEDCLNQLDSEGCSRHSSTSDMDEWANDLEQDVKYMHGFKATNYDIYSTSCLPCQQRMRETGEDTTGEALWTQPTVSRTSKNINMCNKSSCVKQGDKSNHKFVKDASRDHEACAMWMDSHHFHCSLGESPTVPPSPRHFGVQVSPTVYQKSEGTPSSLHRSDSSVHFCCYLHHKGHDLSLSLKSSHNIDCDEAVRKSQMRNGKGVQTGSKETSFSDKIASTFRKLFNLKHSNKEKVHQKSNTVVRDNIKVEQPSTASDNMDKDVAYKELIKFIVTNETNLFMGSCVKPDRGSELFAVREFPQSSQGNTSDIVISHQPLSQSDSRSINPDYNKHPNSHCANHLNKHDIRQSRSLQDDRYRNLEKQELSDCKKQMNCAHIEDLHVTGFNTSVHENGVKTRHSESSYIATSCTSRVESSTHAKNMSKPSLRRKSRGRRRLRQDTGRIAYSDDEDEGDVFIHDYSTTQELLKAEESILLACNAVSAQQASKSQLTSAACHVHVTADASSGSNLPGKQRDYSCQPNDKDCRRYYHVFREGELVSLIEKYVPCLEVVESRYDHANWSVIVQKW